MKPTIEEAPVERLYWKIGEVAEELNVETHTIRFYAESFKLAPHRNRKGDRRFTKDEIVRLRAIVGLANYVHLAVIKDFIDKGRDLPSVLQILQYLTYYQEPVLKVVHCEGVRFRIEGDGDLKMMQE